MGRHRGITPDHLQRRVVVLATRRPVILLGWQSEPFRRRSAHARNGTSHIAQDPSTDSRTRDRQGYGPVRGHLLQLSLGRESFGHGPITHRRMCSTGNSRRVVRLDWCDGRPIRGLQTVGVVQQKRATLTTTLVPGKGAHRRVSLVAALGDGGKTPPWSTTADTEGPAELVWLARHAVYGLA